MKLIIATEQLRPIKHELWRYDDPIVVGGKLLVKAPKERRRAASKRAALAMATPTEWLENKAEVVTVRDFQAGDIEELSWMEGGKLVKNGYLRVYLSPTAHLKLSPADYTGKPPRITVPQSVMDAIDQSQMTTRAKSIADGELTLWP